MNCTKCNAELPPNSKFCPQCGTAVAAGPAIQVQQKIGTVGGSVTGAVLGDSELPGGLAVVSNQMVDNVAAGGAVAGVVMGGQGPTYIGGQQHYGNNVQGNQRVVNMDGGVNIQGSVTTGGDIVGRDKVNNSINVGNITGSTGVAIGSGAHAQVSQTSGLSAAEVSALFTSIYAKVQARPADADTAEIKQTVERIEKETTKGDQANPNKVEGLLKTLASMAPDIGDVVIATLTNPAAGIATVLRKVAEKARAEAG